MNIEIYYRKFNEKEIVKTLCDFKKSFFPPPMFNSLHKALKNGRINPEDWLLCPLYSDENFQIGVTGSVEVHEERENAVFRELGEELGLVPARMEDLLLIQENVWYRRNGKQVDFPVYDIYIKNCRPVPEHADSKLISQNEDDRTRKIGCYVYGKEIDLFEFLNREKIFRYQSSDDIIGIAMVPAKKIFRSI